MAPAPKSEFRNDFAGYIGVQVRNDAGTGYRGIGVKPGASIWLDEDEQVATANAHRRDEDNPFINGHLTLVTEATKIRNRRPIGFTEDGQAPAPPVPEPAAEAAEEPQEPSEDPEKAKREAEARKVQEERKAAEESARAAAQRQHDKPQKAEAAKKTTAAAKKAASTEEVGTPAAAG